MNYLRSHLGFFAIIALVIIVLLLAGYVAFDTWQNKKNDNTNRDQQKQLSVIKNDFAFNKLPEQFPADVPIEQGAEITQNYNASTPDGRFQATRTFITTKSLAENLKIYQSYLKNNGWKILATLDEDNYKMVLGSKDNSQLQVSINENSISNVKTVDISLTIQTTENLTSGFRK